MRDAKIIKHREKKRKRKNACGFLISAQLMVVGMQKANKYASRAVKNIAIYSQFCQNENGKKKF